MRIIYHGCIAGLALRPFLMRTVYYWTPHNVIRNGHWIIICSSTGMMSAYVVTCVICKFFLVFASVKSLSNWRPNDMLTPDVRQPHRMNNAPPLPPRFSSGISVRLCVGDPDWQLQRMNNLPTNIFHQQLSIGWPLHLALSCLSSPDIAV